MSEADPGFAVARVELVAEVFQLKQPPDHFILAHGGARLAQSLMASGMIDEYRLAMHPVLLGQGQPPFSALRSPADRRPISATAFASGIVATVYQPA